MRIREVMTSEVESCDTGLDLAAAAMIMWRRDCGVIPVVDRETRRAVGIITDRDICMAVATQHRRAGEISVGEVCSRILHACQPDDDVHVAMDIMRTHQVRRIPVIDAEGRLLGIVSVHDLVMRGLTPTAGRRSKLAVADIVAVLTGVGRSSTSESEERRPARSTRTGAVPSANRMTAAASSPRRRPRAAMGAR